MKKTLVLAFAIFSVLNLDAQSENNLKNFRFGLKAAPSLNWYRPDNTKKYENNGIVGKFNWGMMMEFRLNNVASIATGLEVAYDGGKINFLDTVGYYIADDAIIKTADTAGKPYQPFRLTSRKYNATYITLPFNLKMKTKDIGGMTYFGLFGISLGIKVKAKSDDEGYLGVVKSPYSTSTTVSTIEDLDITKDMGFMRMGLNIGGGAEYNLSGSTSIVFGLNYNLGFTNVLPGKSDYLSDYAWNGSVLTTSKLQQKAASHNISLTLGILF